jgi:hypothetical protein
MADSARSELPGPLHDTGAEHDAKTEDLLLTGLDHYFAGDYDQAINLWTRVLFVDRGHARARAYIERARSAQAEQFRESEELLHKGVAAFDRGEIDLARRLLMSSLDRGGPQELALPILARLNRLEAAVSAVESAQRPSVARPVSGGVPPRTSVRPMGGWLVLLIAAVVGAALVVWGGQPGLIGWPMESTPIAAPAAPLVEEPLPLPQPGAIALRRARRLLTTGHPIDALRTLSSIRPTDPLRAEADRLTADIQRGLLTVVPADPAVAAEAGTSPAVAGPGR